MVTLENYEEYMLMDADGELNAAEKKELLAFVSQHPELQKEYDMYMAAHIAPDMELTYEHKAQLLKPEPSAKAIGFRSWWAYSAAAGIAALIGIWLLKEQPAADIRTAAVTPDRSAPVAATTQDTNNKILHSQPVEAIASENAYTHRPNAIAHENTNKHKRPLLKNKAPEVPGNTLTDEPASISALPVQPLKEQELHTTAGPGFIPVAPLPSFEQGTNTHDSKLLALLDLEDTQGIAELKDAVSEKVHQAKEIKNRIKNTDVTVKLGNKQLFTVNF